MLHLSKVQFMTNTHLRSTNSKKQVYGAQYKTRIVLNAQLQSTANLRLNDRIAYWHETRQLKIIWISNYVAVFIIKETDDDRALVG